MHKYDTELRTSLLLSDFSDDDTYDTLSSETVATKKMVDDRMIAYFGHESIQQLTKRITGIYGLTDPWKISVVIDGIEFFVEGTLRNASQTVSHNQNIAVGLTLPDGATDMVMAKQTVAYGSTGQSTTQGYKEGFSTYFLDGVTSSEDNALGTSDRFGPGYSSYGTITDSTVFRPLTCHAYSLLVFDAPFSTSNHANDITLNVRRLF
jgi:hypothetical protein